MELGQERKSEGSGPNCACGIALEACAAEPPEAHEERMRVRAEAQELWDRQRTTTEPSKPAEPEAPAESADELVDAAGEPEAPAESADEPVDDEHQPEPTPEA